MAARQNSELLNFELINILHFWIRPGFGSWRFQIWGADFGDTKDNVKVGVLGCICAMGWAGLVCTTVHYKPIVINIKQYKRITRSTRERQCHMTCANVFCFAFALLLTRVKKAGEEFDSGLSPMRGTWISLSYEFLAYNRINHILYNKNWAYKS